MSDTPGRRLLVAEDDGINRLYITTVLKKSGYEVREAEDGRQALEAALSERFDLVLMDVSMPEMDGMQVTRAIRAKEAERGDTRVPILALTAHVYAKDIEECLAAGMDGFVSKPFSEKELLKLIEERLTR